MMQTPNADLKDFATFKVHGPNGLVVHLNEDRPIVKLQHRTSADSEDGTAIMMATLSVSSNGLYIVHAESVGDLSFGILHRLYPKQTTCTKDNAFCVL